MKEKNCDCIFDIICNLRAVYDFLKEEIFNYATKGSK